MNILERLLPNHKRQNKNSMLVEKSLYNDNFSLSNDDFDSNLYTPESV